MPPLLFASLRHGSSALRHVAGLARSTLSLPAETPSSDSGEVELEWEWREVSGEHHVDVTVLMTTPGEYRTLVVARSIAVL